MDAVTFLEQPKRLMEEIQDDIDDLAYMRSCVEKVTTNLSFTAGRGGKDERAFENSMIDIKEEEDKIWEKTEKLKKVILDVASVINLLQDSNMRNLLRMRYLKEKSWSEIAAELPVGSRYVYTVHRQALAEVEKILRKRQTAVD